MRIAKFLFLLPVHAYRVLVSPLLGTACRFTPTCSQYAIDAVHAHGIVKGGLMALARVARCNPWCASGHDPACTGEHHGR